MNNTNVVPLFKPKPEPSKLADTTGLVGEITDWAEREGIDIESEQYSTYCTGLITWLQIMKNQCPRAKGTRLA